MPSCSFFWVSVVLMKTLLKSQVVKQGSLVELMEWQQMVVFFTQPRVCSQMCSGCDPVMQETELLAT